MKSHTNRPGFTRQAALRPLSRRHLLRGAGGVALALPWLEIMLPGRKAHAAAPKRFMVFFTPNGTVRSNWAPTGSSTDFKLSRILAPLEPHKQDIVVINGVDQKMGGFGDGHTQGMASMLTGTPCNSGPWNPNTAGWASGLSIDQELANKIGGGTKFPSLEFGIQVGVHGQPGGSKVTVWTRMCYKGSDQPIVPENSPYSMYNRVFSDLTGDPAALTRLRATRKSVLDALGAEYKGLLVRLGGEDRKRFDSHVQSLREIEVALDGQGAAIGACKGPTQAAPVDINNNANYPIMGKLQSELAVRALACDLTRVATLQWSHSVGCNSHTWVDAAGAHHELSHNEAGETEKLTRINTWYTQQFANLLVMLKSVPEGNGTLLDNTVVLMCNEMANGGHSGTDAPYVLAGRAGGALKTGRFLNFAGAMPNNNLLLSLLNAMGVPAKTFGKADWCTGPLPGLL